jgi:hypothetical protein
VALACRWPPDAHASHQPPPNSPPVSQYGAESLLNGAALGPQRQPSDVGLPVPRRARTPQPHSLSHPNSNRLPPHNTGMRVPTAPVLRTHSQITVALDPDGLVRAALWRAVAAAYPGGDDVSVVRRAAAAALVEAEMPYPGGPRFSLNMPAMGVAVIHVGWVGGFWWVGRGRGGLGDAVTGVNNIPRHTTTAKADARLCNGRPKPASALGLGWRGGCETEYEEWGVRFRVRGVG